MTEKPILFNTEMVRAILDSRKTQTRRIVKNQSLTEECLKICGKPFYPGDVLWVRETWTVWSRTFGTMPAFHYKADGEDLKNVKWHPSIHMPKEAARIFLRVTGVRVERLQDIDEDGVCNEGAERIISGCEHMDYSCVPPEPCFNVNPCKDCIINRGYPELFGKMVWDRTIKLADLHKYGWDANPWVWVISFKKIERDQLLRYADNDVAQGGLMPAT